MTSELGSGEDPSFCGNCGAVVQAGSRACGACGQPVTDTGRPPQDYIPYCRSCGVGVPWGMGHTCRRCGVAPLCERHYRADTGLCFDCAAVPSAATAASTGSRFRCGGCGAPVAPYTEFCSNCGRPVALTASAHYASVEYMGFWIRAGAYVVDWILAYVVVLLIAQLLGISPISSEVDPNTVEDISVLFENINYSFLLMFWGVSSAHTLLLTAWRGQTLGKMLFRIQVVNADGNIPSLPRVAVRELLRSVVLLALFPLGFVYLWVALDWRKRGPHDYLGGSYVVRKQRNGRRTSGGL